MSGLGPSWVRKLSTRLSEADLPHLCHRTVHVQSAGRLARSDRSNTGRCGKRSSGRHAPALYHLRASERRSHCLAGSRERTRFRGHLEAQHSEAQRRSQNVRKRTSRGIHRGAAFPLYAPPVFQSDNGDDKRDSISIRMPRSKETGRPEICAAKIARAPKTNIVARILYRLTHSPIVMVKAAACGDVTLVNQLLQKAASVAENMGGA